MTETGVLVVAETREGDVTALTRELLGMTRDLGMIPAAMLFAESQSAAAELIAHGAGRVYWCKAAEDYDAACWLPAIEALARTLEPAVILAGHTHAGADFAPRLAFRLGSGIATGCVGVAREETTLLFTRACYGGNVRESVTLPTRPAIATVKAGVGTPQRDDARRGEVIAVSAPTPDTRTRVVARERDNGAGSRLEDARTIVAGGRGLESADGFRELERLAAALGGAVGASRVPCDLGWCPHSWQIGLTGKTVTPDLYFAVGISGAGHHLAGCGNAKAIVAVNTDPQAAIFREARFGIVGDYREVVPALIDALAELS